MAPGMTWGRIPPGAAVRAMSCAPMAPGGRMLQYTYSLVSPLPEAKLGVKGRRCGIVVRNVPPAWVWSYERVGKPQLGKRPATLAA